MFIKFFEQWTYPIYRSFEKVIVNKCIHAIFYETILSRN